MSDSLSELSKRFLSLGLGMATLSKEKAEEIVNEMIQKGEVKRGEARQFLSTAKVRGKEIRGELQSVVEEQLDRALRTLRIGVQSDLKNLEKRLTRIEARLDRLEKGGRSASKKKPGKKKGAKTKKKTAKRKKASKTK